MRDFEHTFQVGRFRVRVWHKSRSLLGTFGGGWRWAFGVKAGKNTLFAMLFVVGVTIRWDKSQSAVLANLWGSPPEIVQVATVQTDAMKRWTYAHGGKVPDMPAEEKKQ